MCLVNRKGVTFHWCDKPVYKVMEMRTTDHQSKFYTPFRDELGLARSVQGMSVDYMLTHTAIYFDEGYGYHCFASLASATKYCQELMATCQGFYSILKFVIPAGVKYEVGRIGPSYKGAGLSAIRTEQLTEEKNGKD